MPVLKSGELEQVDISIDPVRSGNGQVKASGTDHTGMTRA